MDTGGHGMFSKRLGTEVEVMSTYVIVDNVFLKPRLESGQKIFRIGRRVYQIIAQDGTSTTCALIEHSGSFMSTR